MRVMTCMAVIKTVYDFKTKIVACLQLQLCEDTVCPLLSAGVMFQMPHIIKSCCTFLEHQLDPSKYCTMALRMCCFG